MSAHFGTADEVGAAAAALRDRTAYRITVLIVLAGVCVLAFLVNVSLGSLRISIPEVLRALFVDSDDVNRQIIWNIRLPRTIVGGLVGMSLALSGAILQGVMRNPLASPTIIGVSAGAGVAAMILLVALPQYYMLLTPGAFIGAFASTVLIYLLAWKNGIKPMRLILAGVAVSAFLGAITNSLMIFFPERVQGVIGFMVGGLIARTWKHFDIIWPYTLTGVVAVTLLSKQLNILMLGDEVATGLGLRVERTRMILIGISALLAASAVSIVGLLGFVGLIVPHIARMFVGSDYRFLTPASALLGAGLVMACDVVARVAFDPVEIPVGIIMAALGAPFFLYLLRGGLRNEA